MNEQSAAGSADRVTSSAKQNTRVCKLHDPLPISSLFALCGARAEGLVVTTAECSHERGRKQPRPFHVLFVRVARSPSPLFCLVPSLPSRPVSCLAVSRVAHIRNAALSTLVLMPS